ncbi:hypothetical protein AAF712_012402 [Marasmius tenuissimus]|uniref:WD40 repeat-like protein n=1 Tax=Marasmius tenuissimus TaxID=585030 RepID=A0ABR2ZIM8_9AGAR
MDKPKYILKFTLTDFAGSISSLAFSDDGKFLAAASHDGNIVIYATCNARRPIRSFTSPDSPPNIVVWGIGYEIIVGLLDGRILRYPNATRRPYGFRSLMKGSQDNTPAQELADLGRAVVAMTFHKETKRLYVGCDSGVSLYRRRDSAQWIFCTEIQPPAFEYTPVGFTLPPHVPVSILVPKWHDEIIICYRDQGIRNYRLCDDGKEVRVGWSIPVFNRLCPSSLSPDCAYIASWNLNEGLDLYCIRRANLELTETITLDSQSPTQVNALLDVKFLHNGKDILVGSNTGKPVIVNRATKEVVQVLIHSQAKAITPINAYWSSLDNEHLLATGDRDMGQETAVKLWFAAPPVNRWRKLLSWPTSAVNSVTYWWLMQSLLIFLVGRSAFSPWLQWSNPFVASGVRLLGMTGRALSQWASDGSGAGSPSLDSLATGEGMTSSLDVFVAQPTVEPVVLTTVTSTLVIPVSTTVTSTLLVVENTALIADLPSSIRTASDHHFEPGSFVQDSSPTCALGEHCPMLDE